MLKTTLDAVLQYGIEFLIASTLVLASSYLKSKISGTKYDKAYKKIVKFVYDAEEEIIGKNLGSERKQQVLEKVSEYLKKIKIIISPDEIDDIIEGTVKIINLLKSKKTS